MAKIICEEKNCSGCLACVVACIDQHYDETAGEALSCRIHEKITTETGLVRYTTRTCHHCADAPCVKVYPTEALYINEMGLVIPVRDKCIGCRACEAACPFDIPRFDGEGKLVKCDGCAARQAHGLLPACVRTCNTGALKLGE
ncbi:MAG: 4Fe-4S binding protein [Clostridia bacterium]|nr:4Fe-4S binding protein [Clostridia bacterium]